MLYYIRLYFTSINRSPLCLRTCCVVPRHVTPYRWYLKQLLVITLLKDLPSNGVVLLRAFVVSIDCYGSPCYFARHQLCLTESWLTQMYMCIVRLVHVHKFIYIPKLLNESRDFNHVNSSFERYRYSSNCTSLCQEQSCVNVNPCLVMCLSW